MCEITPRYSNNNNITNKMVSNKQPIFFQNYFFKKEENNQKSFDSLKENIQHVPSSLRVEHIANPKTKSVTAALGAVHTYPETSSK